MEKGMILPLFCALAFIFVYPHPARWVYAYWQREQQKEKLLRDKIEGQKLLTVEESQSALRRAYQIRAIAKINFHLGCILGWYFLAQFD